MTDTELGQLIKQSSHQAFHELFKRYHEDIYHFIYYKVHNQHIAEDLTQDTFIKIWEVRSGIKESMSLKSYIYTIANNLTLNYLRHQKVTLRFVKETQHLNTSVEDSADGSLEKNEFLREIYSAIETLPEKAKVIFLMSRVDNLSYKEIAGRLQISVKTVESHIGRSLKKLREILVKE